MNMNPCQGNANTVEHRRLVNTMDVLEMYPLDFEEFAYANKVSPTIMESLRKSFRNKEPVSDIVHEKMMELFRLYLIVGGIICPTWRPIQVIPWVNMAWLVWII